MPTIRSIMTREVLTLEPDMTLREAVDALGGARISGAPVVNGGRVIGVLSRTDLLEFQSSTPGVPTYRDEPHEVQGDHESGWEAEGVDPPSAYFVEMWDNPGADVVERFSRPGAPEWDVLSEHTVEEVMTHGVVTLPPDAGVEEAARLMTELDIHRVLVTRDGHLEGIVSTMDVVRAVAQGMLRAPGEAGGRANRGRSGG